MEYIPSKLFRNLMSSLEIVDLFFSFLLLIWNKEVRRSGIRGFEATISFSTYSTVRCKMLTMNVNLNHILKRDVHTLSWRE